MFSGRRRRYLKPGCLRITDLPIHQQQHCMEAQTLTLSSRAKPRDLLCALTSNKAPTSELASLNQAVCSS
jgi:hypothetical protein